MKTTMTLATLILTGFFLTACEKDGPMENAGEAMDDAAEKLTGAGNDLGNAIEDACEDVKEGAGAKDTDC